MRTPDGINLVVEACLATAEFHLDVDFTVTAGQTTVLLGPNGAGKSTTVAIIAGLVTPDHGFVASPARVLTDTDAGVSVPVERRRVGVVFADGLLFEHLTVSQNVAFGVPRGASHAPSRQRRSRLATARAFLEELGLTHLADRHPATLSSGQAQRVALARTLASEPEMLLADEPLARIDHAARTTLRRALARSLTATDAPRLVITHDATEAFLLADQMLIIEEGRITQRGKPDDIRRHPRTPYAADLAGTNLFQGTTSGGVVTLADHAAELTSSDTATSGAVLLTVHPRAATLHASEPSGSPRNVWEAVVDVVEPLGEVTRVVLAHPLPLTVDITPGAARELDVRPAGRVWVAVKATEVELQPAEPLG